MSDSPFEEDFYDNTQTSLNNNPEKYPYRPPYKNQDPPLPKPTRFLKTFTNYDLSELRLNPNSEKELKINNEVNEIKYRVLKTNSLGQKKYEHLYFVEHDTNTVSSFPDYFTDILDKLIDVFPEATFEYTLLILKDRHNKTVINTDKTIHNNDYNSKKSENITQKDNGKYSISNTIKISWS